MISVYNLIIHGWYRQHSMGVCLPINKTHEHMFIKNAFILDEWVGKDEEVLFQQTGTHQPHHHQRQQHRDDHANAIIMTRWVYTALLLLFLVIPQSYLCVAFYLSSSSSSSSSPFWALVHIQSIPTSCHRVNSIIQASRWNYGDITDE